MTCLFSSENTQGQIPCLVYNRYLQQGENEYDGSLCYGCLWDGYHASGQGGKAVVATPHRSTLSPELLGLKTGRLSLKPDGRVSPL